MRTRFGKSRRTSGSPPVSRTSVTPMPASTRTTRSISSKRSTSARSSHGSPSAGMQYWQRKLQRSVTETRRSEIGRPCPSTSWSVPLLNGHILALALTRVDLPRPRDLLLLVVHHLEPLGHPARGARDREHHREHLGGEAEGLVDEAGVEVDVRVELARGEVVVVHGVLLELYREIELRVAAGDL